MLVLTRKIGERIVIGDNIYLCVVEVNNNKVRLGIEAPASVPINRLEVHLRGPERVEVETCEASASTSHRNEVRRRKATAAR
jgi:carbon storage regulator CsrA